MKWRCIDEMFYRNISPPLGLYSIKVESTILRAPVAQSVGYCSLGVRCFLGMREVLGSNPLGGNILCSPCPLEETKNRGPNTSISHDVCIDQ